MKKFGLKRQLAGCAWALLFGIAAMGWLMGNMTLVFLSLLALSAAPVVLSALYAGYGPIPAALGLLLGGGTVALLSGLLTGAAPRGLAVGLGYALTVGVPAGVAAVLTDRRKPYFMRMRWTVGAQLGMLVAAVAAAYLALDQNLVDAYAALLRQSLGVLDRQLSDVLLPYLGALGMLDSATLDAVQRGVLTAAQRAALYDAAVEANVRMMQLALPMMLITMGAAMGIATAGVQSAIRARRGDEPRVDHVQLNAWYLPARFAIGATAAMLFGRALNWMGIEGADSMALALGGAWNLLFTIQGMAAVARRLRKQGATPARRFWTIAALWLLQYALVMLGVASSLFGSRGIVTEIARKRREKSDKEGHGR